MPKPLICPPCTFGFAFTLAWKIFGKDIGKIMLQENTRLLISSFSCAPLQTTGLCADAWHAIWSCFSSEPVQPDPTAFDRNLSTHFVFGWGSDFDDSIRLEYADLAAQTKLLYVRCLRHFGVEVSHGKRQFMTPTPNFLGQLTDFSYCSCIVFNFTI